MEREREGSKLQYIDWFQKGLHRYWIDHFLFWKLYLHDKDTRNSLIQNILDISSRLLQFIFYVIIFAIRFTLFTFPAIFLARSLGLCSWPSPLSLALLHFVYTEDRSLETSGALFHTHIDHHQQSIHGFRFCCFVGGEKFLGEWLATKRLVSSKNLPLI